MKTIEVKVEGTGSEYVITIGRDSREKLYEYLSLWYKGKKAAIITDNNVNRLYGASIYKEITDSGLGCRLISVEPGEKSKSLRVLSEIYGALSEFNISRGDLIIALGGGVVGDLAGFAAATYLRGIPYIQVPTTLLSQVDSSVGGKTAIDLPGGKNLVGAFYQPAAVFIDPRFLDTLEERYLTDGMAEVIKYGCIKDEVLFNKLMGYGSLRDCIEDMEELVYTCCSIKRSVVEIDERDRGERMLLNFGHTLGHAVEQYYNYEKYSHGEAVAMGMAEITARSEAAGLTKKGTAAAVEKILAKYGLPSSIPVADKNVLLDVMRLDKKIDGDSISIVLLEGPGAAFLRKMSLQEFSDFIAK
ncbi:MAG: 3-dehydroquinate synthase [Pseudomonadota bacterium]